MMSKLILTHSVFRSSKMPLIQLPPEIWYQIFLHLDYPDLLRLQGIPKFLPMISDPVLWCNKLNHEVLIHVDLAFFKASPLPPWERYIQLMTLIGFRVLPGSERYAPLEWCLLKAVTHQNIFLVIYFLSFPQILPMGLNQALFEATKQNQGSLITLLMSRRDMDLNWGLAGAAAGGHMHWVNYFIACRALDFNCAIRVAQHYGQTKMSRYLEYKKAIYICSFCQSRDSETSKSECPHHN
jgi:hypothetical protein